MSVPKFKAGDKVISSISPEVNQPMEIVCVDSMHNSIHLVSDKHPVIYKCVGKHVRGNLMTARLEEKWLTLSPTSPITSP